MDWHAYFINARKSSCWHIDSKSHEKNILLQIKRAPPFCRQEMSGQWKLKLQLGLMIAIDNYIKYGRTKEVQLLCSSLP